MTRSSQRTAADRAFSMRSAGPEDLSYVMSLMRANRESVGGLPAPAIEERIERQTLVLGELNGDPFGYLLYDVRGGEIRIPQACIQYDARRRKYGEALVVWLLQRYPDADEVRLRCGADLEANLFWRAMGFTCLAVVEGGSRRGRLLNEWALWLTPRLILPSELATAPAAQLRVDAMYDDTDYLTEQPAGFRTVQVLPKIAWANRKGTP